MSGKILTVKLAKRLVGSLRPPSDKSLTHRAILFGSLAEGGASRVLNPLLGEDCRATIECMSELGVDIEVFEDHEFGPEPSVLIMRSGPLRQSDIPLDCGNSGTTMRLLAGVLASRPGLDCTMVGDSSLSKRPMRRIVEPLTMMGASIEGDTPPLKVSGRKLSGIHYMSPVASAQVKSCVLLAGLEATGDTWVSEPFLSRDHTERMLEASGVELLRDGDLAVGLRGGQSIWPIDFNVPADISSAAFFIVGAAMVPGSSVRLSQIGVNPTRTGVLDVLDQCGVQWSLDSSHDVVGEPVADVLIESQADLRPFEVCGSLVPRLIDEIPVLAVLATQCDGVSRIRDASELRVKESDRIETVANGLRAMGANVETTPDGMVIEGPVRLRGSTIDAIGDHRIAMAFAIAGLVAEGETTILNAQSVASSYPGFESDLRSLIES